MDEQRNDTPQPMRPRRRRKTKFELFKEAYLPYIIGLAAVILIIIFIVGAVSRSGKQEEPTPSVPTETTAPTIAEDPKLAQEAQTLLAQAEELAKDFDFDGAIALLNSFSGDISKYPALSDKIAEYEAEKGKIVAWDDPGKVVHLSFQMLVADTERAFSYPLWSSNINKNFVTTDEFSKILQQLYDNGYVLVDLDDIITTETNATGATVYKAKTLYLPSGKKPLMLTQTNVNYNYYLVDADKNGVPDTDSGFAHKLLWDGQNFSCQMVDSSGQITTGDYDLVPILEKFIAEHPAFSHEGARANLALTGYNGLLGYRTHPEYRDTAEDTYAPNAQTILGQDQYEKEIRDAMQVIEALRSKGYTLSCYTYANIGYGKSSTTTSKIKNDLKYWNNYVTDIMGETSILTHAQNADLSEYSGAKFDVLQEQGFRYYLGFCTDGTPWAIVDDSYVRMGRVMVSGYSMTYNSDWFDGLFDTAAVLNTTRKPISQ